MQEEAVTCRYWFSFCRCIGETVQGKVEDREDCGGLVSTCSESKVKSFYRGEEVFFSRDETGKSFDHAVD